MTDYFSLRCSICATYWPLDRETYNPCPECGGAVWDNAGDPLPDTEALSRKNHADFERWLDQNGRRDPVELLERNLDGQTA